jgi:hypothetical protein
MAGEKRQYPDQPVPDEEGDAEKGGVPFLTHPLRVDCPRIGQNVFHGKRLPSERDVPGQAFADR